jgi:flagellar basal-body rod protein FlgG
MMTAQVITDAISHNIANANTSGYCKDEALVLAFPGMLLSRIDSDGAAAVGQTGTGSVIDGTYTSFEEGPVQETGNQSDLALHGNAFFVVSDRQGQLFFTRDGDFMLNQDHQLVTSNGDSVLGESNGRATAIFVPGGKLQVAGDGTLSGAVDSQNNPVTRLDLAARPTTGTWSKIGDTLFTGPGAQAAVNFTVQQGASDGSNVNAVSEMVGMIDAMRAYEANAKVIQAIDSTLSSAVTSIGNVQF